MTYTRVKQQTGKPEQKFTARYTGRAEKKGGEWRLSTSGTTWEGSAPFPPALVEEGMYLNTFQFEASGPSTLKARIVSIPPPIEVKGT